MNTALQSAHVLKDAYDDLQAAAHNLEAHRQAGCDTGWQGDYLRTYNELGAIYSNAWRDVEVLSRMIRDRYPERDDAMRLLAIARRYSRY